jgi:predicted DCC family thiol-disulfide oxidoreductase YuxK
MTDQTGGDTGADRDDAGPGRSTQTPDRGGDDPVAVSAEHPVLLFDGVCNLCNWSVQFLVEHDPEGSFRFAPLQSAVARDLLESCEYGGEPMDSVVLVENGECYAKSAAVIRATEHLGTPYSLLRPAGVLPERLRNVAYDLVAEHRYRLFGRRDRCMRPTPDIEEQFLAGRPGPGQG